MGWANEASLFSARFVAKGQRKFLAATYDPTRVLCSVVFWSSFVHSLFLDLDSYDGSSPDGMFPFFTSRFSFWLLGPKLVVIFRHLVKRGSFLVCGRLAVVVSVPKEFSSDNGDYSHISITPVLSKIGKDSGWEIESFNCKVTICFILSFYTGRACEHVMLSSCCLTIYRLLWTGAWREGLFS